MFTLEFWYNLFNDPEFAGSMAGHIIGGIISGLFTLLAALVSLYVYFSRKSREKAQNLLGWISDFNRKFQNNDSYKDIREALAAHRPQILLYICLELYHSHTIRLNSEKSPYSKKKINELVLSTFSVKYNIKDTTKHLPFEHFEFSENGIESCSYTLNWTFIRQLTDYLRFHEETLLACEVLAGINNKSMASKLINGYYWHIKSVILGWGDRRFNKLFIQYLIHNNYYKLSEIGLFMFGTEDKAFIEESINTIRTVSIKRNPQKITMKKIRKKWSGIIEEPSLLSGGIITKNVIDILNKRKK